MEVSGSICEFADLEEKMRQLREWMEEREEGVSVVIGGGGF